MILVILFVCLLVVVIASMMTNPFSRFSVVRKPLEVQGNQKQSITLHTTHRIIVRNNAFWVTFAWLKSGFHVLETRYLHSPRSRARSVEGIIRDIHTLRYDPRKLLLISGDHFNTLYVRNLGVFYYPLLDTRIPSDEEDWSNRQTVYLETVAFALAVFEQYSKLTTTIVPTAVYGVTCVNFYAYPSDSLHGILYALAVLAGRLPARIMDYTVKDEHVLATPSAARVLLEKYQSLLKKLYADYTHNVYDKRLGLIKKTMHLSGAKDITRRECAFYDNVIFWRTTELAMMLGIIPKDKVFLRNLKKRILQQFWLPKAGHFLEDLSNEAVQNQYYSSDWLVVLFTGFLDPLKSSERRYFEDNVHYIQREGIDRPFALKYQQDRRSQRQFLPVRLAVAAYGGDAIWSFWGMEYLKMLLLLYKATGRTEYLQSVDYQIEQYKQVMQRDAGFPEVYDSNGKMLQTPLYRSIRQTGWVIGFEQVLAMRRSF